MIAESLDLSLNGTFRYLALCLLIDLLALLVKGILLGIVVIPSSLAFSISTIRSSPNRQFMNRLSGSMTKSATNVARFSRKKESQMPNR